MSFVRDIADTTGDLFGSMIELTSLNGILSIQAILFLLCHIVLVDEGLSVPQYNNFTKFFSGYPSSFPALDSFTALSALQIRITLLKYKNT